MSRDPDRGTMERAYARWAPLYDAVCGPIFESGRRAAAAVANRIGGRILEVGVGTGLSFDDYDRTTRVIGVDMSAPMVAKAKARLDSGRHPHVEAVTVMDATKLAFADRSFDCVVAQFVITLVADPERVLDECARVLRPGGEIVLINHFYSERGVTALLERTLSRPVRRLGLRPDFPFGRLARWAAVHPEVELAERRVLEPLRLYTLVRFRRREAEAAPFPSVRSAP